MRLSSIWCVDLPLPRIELYAFIPPPPSPTLTHTLCLNSSTMLRKRKSEGGIKARIRDEDDDYDRSASTLRACRLLARHHASSTTAKRSNCLRHFTCSLPTVVALLYFFFLVVVGVITLTTTTLITGKTVCATWMETHHTHIASVSAVVDGVAAIMHHTTSAAASLYAQSSNPVESNKTLTMLCAMLAMGDMQFQLRTLVLGAFAVEQYASCAHADRSDPYPTNMTALMSDKGRLYGNFYINPQTYTYYEPPILQGKLDTNLTARQIIQRLTEILPIFQKIDAYMNGTLHALQPSDLWSMPSTQPNNLYHTFPLMLLGESVPHSSTVRLSDFSQTRIDGNMLLNTSLLTEPGVTTRAMVLINQSLDLDDPKVLSNNWGQETVRLPTYSLVVMTNTTYLKVSNISDPLMREAVRHVDLKALQHNGYNVTTVFRYHGAPAIVTAQMYETPYGFRVPIVVVSPQHAVTGPYLTVRDVCCGMVAVAAVLLTALCYFAMDRYLSRPLRRVSAAMVASVRRGVRQPVRADACDVVQLTEVRELTAAYNAAVAQLRVVDEFVLADAAPQLCERAEWSGTGSARRARTRTRLRQHYLTIATVRVRACGGIGGGNIGGGGGGGGGVDTDAVLRRHACDARRSRLAAVVNAVAEAATIQMTNSGPFASADSLAAFVGAVRELCEARGGRVHRVTPDTCVLHFSRSVAARHVGGGDVDGSAVRRAAAADACAAVDFTQSLERWVELRAAQEAMPDVRVLVDTGVFTCGPYCAPGSEQTLCVALGRDVQRELGHVLERIGVRVAMTEETAVLLRGGDGTRSVRQLPVEALCIGRVGLDADVVILYEVLPGAVDGDAAWQLYTRCCFDGFSAMVRGDYAGALCAFKEVAGIADLEPGLMPRSLRREAARSDAVGGAVSIQVERLMTECERRVRAGCTESFVRARRVPLGVDAVLAGLPSIAGCVMLSSPIPIAASPLRRAATAASPASSVSAVRGVCAPVLMRACTSTWRYVVSVNTANGCMRRVVGGRPEWVRDNYGLHWYLPRTAAPATGGDAWMAPYTALGSAGTLCTVTTLLLREGAGLFRDAMAGAPDGPMCDALRSAIPVWTATEATKARVHRLFEMHLASKHPNILRILGYSLSVEGCVMLMWEFCPNGSLRNVLSHYAHINTVSLYGFGFSVISALVHLHSRGLVHGSLSLDTIIVGSDGICRLVGRYTNYELDQGTFLVSATCYVSPAMAADRQPTPACDMFCYGLIVLEALTRQSPWTWAARKEGEPQRSEEELNALMAAGGQAFCKAVVEGRVVPNTVPLDDSQMINSYDRFSLRMVHELLSYDPSKRPTATEVLSDIRYFLNRCSAASSKHVNKTSL